MKRKLRRIHRTLISSDVAMGRGACPQSNGPKKEGRVRGEIKEKEKEREIIQGDRLLFKAYTIR